MFMSFPDSRIINVPGSLASELLSAAEYLPVVDNRNLYSTTLQALVADSIRERCPDGFDWLVGQINESVACRPYAVLVRGLRFDNSNRLFVAINRAFGEMAALPYQEPRAQLVQYLEPRTDLRSSRGGRESERLHTDAADWGAPIRFISMLCVHAHEHGQGRSRLLDFDAIRDEVVTHMGTDSLRLLNTQEVPWQLHSSWGGGVRWQTVLTDSTVCWRRYTILRAIEIDGAELSREMLALLNEFERVIEGSDRAIDFLMDEGELLFSDNTRGLHARTPIMDTENSNRLMIRSWIKATQMG